MKIGKIGIAIILAFINLAVFLPHAAADGTVASGAPAFEIPEPIELPSVEPGKLSPITRPMPAPGIRVVAHVAPTCDADAGSPVMGARILVITESSVLVAFTNQTGEALFSAAQGPAIVQIEWPVGFVPCSNSSVSAELPNGAGEVRFFAVPTS